MSQTRKTSHTIGHRQHVFFQRLITILRKHHDTVHPFLLLQDSSQFSILTVTLGICHCAVVILPWPVSRSKKVRLSRESWWIMCRLGSQSIKGSNHLKPPKNNSPDRQILCSKNLQRTAAGASGRPADPPARHCRWCRWCRRWLVSLAAGDVDRLRVDQLASWSSTISQLQVGNQDLISVSLPSVDSCHDREHSPWSRGTTWPWANKGEGRLENLMRCDEWMINSCFVHGEYWLIHG